MSRSATTLASLLLLAATGQTAEEVFDEAAAARQLREAAALCERDAGALWGVSLCGPMMIVDPASRRIVANAPDPQGALHERGGVWTGDMPAGVGLANTAKTWNGRLWTMLVWPLPTNERGRGLLLMHEAFHRVQPGLGLATTERNQDQLATLDGRLSFRLELRALRKAVAADGAAAEAAYRDALHFRAWRHARFPGSAANEDALEANEGLAEYTGWKLSGLISDRARLDRRLAGGDQSRSYARSFAYLTGPAYGALLDRFNPGWPADAVRLKALPLPPASRGVRGAGTLRLVGATYGYAAIRAEESTLAADRARAEARWRRTLIDGPTITIPLLSTNYVYDPNAVSPLPAGNVYPTLQAHGPWGSLEAPGGALIGRDWKTLTVGARGIDPGTAQLVGPDLKLQLAPGWYVAGTGPHRRLERRPEPGDGQ